MENLEGSVASIAFTVLRNGLKPDVKMELVVCIYFISASNCNQFIIIEQATNDIGRFGAAVFRVNTIHCSLEL